MTNVFLTCFRLKPDFCDLRNWNATSLILTRCLVMCNAVGRAFEQAISKGWVRALPVFPVSAGRLLELSAKHRREILTGIEAVLQAYFCHRQFGIFLELPRGVVEPAAVQVFDRAVVHEFAGVF